MTQEKETPIKEQRFVVLNRIEGKNGKVYWSRMGSARALEKGGLSLFLKHEPHMNYIIKLEEQDRKMEISEEAPF